MEKNIKKECLYVYNWVTLLYSRDCHSIVNQLYFKNKFILIFLNPSLLSYNSWLSLNGTHRTLTNPLRLQKIYECEWKQGLWSTFFFTHLISPLLSGLEAEIYYQLVASGSVKGGWACHSGIKNVKCDKM